MALRGVNAGAEVLACLILILHLLAIACDGRKMLDEPVPKSLISDVTDGVQDAIEGGLQLAKDAIENLKGQFEGDGTAYSERVQNASHFACSYRTLPDKAKTNFVAINLPQWDEGRACGKCVNVWCTDPFCTTQFEPVKLMVVDQCPECKEGDLDLSIPAYEEVTGRWPHRLKVEWEWSDCGMWFDDDDEIRMDIKDGSNDWWRAFFFSNNRYPIRNVSINGRFLERQQFNFWTEWGDLGKGPYKIALTASTGEIIETTVDDVLKKAQNIGAQFSMRSGISLSKVSSTKDISGESGISSSMPTPAPESDNFADSSKEDCEDVPTKDNFTCEQHKGWGNCDKEWFISDGFCAKTCGRCSSADAASKTEDAGPTPVPSQETSGVPVSEAAMPETQADSEVSEEDCEDVPTKDNFTCEQHKGWGNCDKEWFISDGFCAKTCGRCK
eukprot:jgi/Picsp_1/3963/NSC_01475-R1_carbohydratebinding protein